MPIFLAILLFAIWSSVFSLGKLALLYAPPLFVTGFRMTLGALVILGFLFFAKRSQLRISLKQFASFLLLAIFSIYLTNSLEFWGLKHLSAAKACFIYSLSPFFAALFSYLHFKEKMTPIKWIGMAVGFLAILPVIAEQSGSEELLNAFSFFSWPALSIIGAALFSVYGWVLLRLITKESSEKESSSPLLANGMSMAIGGAFAFIHSFFVESWTPIPVANANFLPFLKGILVITLISNIICYNLYGMLLKRFTATFLSFLGLSSPFFASLHEWIILGTKPSWIMLFSSLFLFLGLWAIYREELKQGYITTSKRPIATTDQ